MTKNRETIDIFPKKAGVDAGIDPYGSLFHFFQQYDKLEVAWNLIVSASCGHTDIEEGSI